MHRSVESRIVRLPDGRDLTGPALEKILHTIASYHRVLHVVKRRGHAADIVEALLDHGARDQSFFEREAELTAMAAALTSPSRTVTCVRDDEHNAWALHVDDRAFGYSRIDTLGAALVASAEYRALRRVLRRNRRAGAWPAPGRRRSAPGGRQGGRTRGRRRARGRRGRGRGRDASRLRPNWPSWRMSAPAAGPGGDGQGRSGRHHVARRLRGALPRRSAARVSRSTATRASAR